jgi:hypothetical protein
VGIFVIEKNMSMEGPERPRENIEEEIANQESELKMTASEARKHTFTEMPGSPKWLEGMDRLEELREEINTKFAKRLPNWAFFGSIMGAVGGAVIMGSPGEWEGLKEGVIRGLEGASVGGALAMAMYALDRIRMEFPVADNQHNHE